MFVCLSFSEVFHRADNLFFCWPNVRYELYKARHLTTDKLAHSPLSSFVFFVAVSWLALENFLSNKRLFAVQLRNCVLFRSAGSPPTFPGGLREGIEIRKSMIWTVIYESSTVRAMLLSVSAINPLSCPICFAWYLRFGLVNWVVLSSSPSPRLLAVVFVSVEMASPRQRLFPRVSKVP